MVMMPVKMCEERPPPSMVRKIKKIFWGGQQQIPPGNLSTLGGELFILIGTNYWKEAAGGANNEHKIGLDRRKNFSLDYGTGMKKIFSLLVCFHVHCICTSYLFTRHYYLSPSGLTFFCICVCEG
eukprot:gene8989-6311_t